MRITRMFGLAVLAAVAAMALVGTTSASATSTVLCEINELVCKEANEIEDVTIRGISADSLLLTNIANVLCTQSEIAAQILLLASPLVGHVTTLSFTNCKDSITNEKCTVTATKLSLLKLLKSGANKAILSAESNQALVQCNSLGLHCVYRNPTTELEVEGSNGSTLATVTYKEEKLPTVSGFFCPASAKWDVTYAITGRTLGEEAACVDPPLYIAE